MSAFKLSAILQGHEKDVRNIVAIDDHTLCSVSRDKTAKLWKRADKSSFEIEATFPHKDSVSSVTYLNPTDVTPKGLIVTGSGDKVIRIWDPEAPFQPISELRGHEDNVCTLYKGSSAIISGSWDKTARVWENNECIQVLKGHTQAVWAVMELSSDGSIITGSADKMIYRWKNGKIVQKFAGHTDCVRGLSLISSDQFASCGNDGAVMIWSLSSGQCVGVHHGHTSFVYSVSSIESNGEIASSGEDRAVRIWKDGNCDQVILFPAVSIWSVASFPNGDIVCASSDSKMRIFTRSKEREASAEEIAGFDEENASFAMSRKTMDKLDVESLPGVERLSQPGKKNGEIITIKENFTVFAYQWDDNSKEWKKVGEVVDSQGSESKKVYEGKEYDYVFDVELEDGRPLKLPYNVSENPYMAAQNFINRNELPPYYLDQIANFVMQNTEGAQLTQTADFSDPITGAHRYIPEPVGKSNSSYSSNNATVSDFVVPTNYKAMSSTNFEGVRKKLLQFIESVDENLKENITPEIIDSVCTNASSGKWESIDSAQAEAIITSSFSWPPEYRFPALDLLGAMVLEWTQPLAQDGMSNRICDSTILALETAALEPQSSNFKSVLGGVRLCVRLLSNMLYQQKSRTSVWSSLQAVLTILYRFTNIPNASLQTSVANLLYNLTLYGEETGQAEHAFDVITIIKEIVSNNSNNPKTLAPAVNSLLLTTGILAKKGSLYRDAIKQGIGSSAQSLESVIANPQDQELYGQVSKFF